VIVTGNIVEYTTKEKDNLFGVLLDKGNGCAKGKDQHFYLEFSGNTYFNSVLTAVLTARALGAAVTITSDGNCPGRILQLTF
jgi:hypothetical protein